MGRKGQANLWISGGHVLKYDLKTAKRFSDGRGERKKGRRE